MALREIESGTYDVETYKQELTAAKDNLKVGTRMWFENEAIRVWEIRLNPGARSPFHAHTNRYFWTVVDGGIARQHMPDGTVVTHEYHVGDTEYCVYSPEKPGIHDLENVGDTVMRFTTVELLD
jgi:oxalate decarboxylase/phosphoglucose isomerase-like protein (cupin superfamily)